jgi:hypothetical protein
MDTALAEAFIHRTHQCCGFALADFTLRHAFVLDALGSPCALSGAGEIAIEDLYSAARICSTRNDEELQTVLDTLRPSTDAEKIEHLAALEICRLDPLPHIIAWNAYLKDHVTLPRLMEVRGGGHWQNHPLLILAAKLMRHGHLSKRDAWWTGYGEARWLSLALDELDPNVKFELLSEARIEKLREKGHAV